MLTGSRSNPSQIKVLIVIDEEAQAYFGGTWSDCKNWATNILEGGDDFMEVPYGIDFQAYSHISWMSPNNTNFPDLLYTIESVFNPADYGCDVVVLMSGQADTIGTVIGRAFILGSVLV